jgi:elongation factor G
MAEFTKETIRNVVVAGHTGCGKTSLLEAILHNLHLTERPGKVDDGTSVSDYDPEEQKRQISINTCLIPVEFRGHKINFLDVPGTPDFVGELRNGARVADAMIVVVDASSGVEVGTERAAEVAEEFGLPLVVVINKINRDNARFDETVADIEDVLGGHPVLMNFPVGEGADFRGVVNLLKMQLAQGQGGKVQYGDIPEELKGRAKELRAALVEAAAEGDDELTVKFLEGEQLDDLEVLRGLKEDLCERRITPIVAASATEGAGVMNLLDFIIECFPAPGEEGPFLGTDSRARKEVALKYDPDAPVAAFVFKTMTDAFAGHLSYFKVLNGTLRQDAYLLNTSRGVEERMHNLMTTRGKKQEAVTILHSGDIGVAGKLNQTHTGDVLCEKSAPVRFDPTPMPPHVIHRAVVALNKEDEDKVGLALHRQLEQDPTLYLHRESETHQTILSGMGEIQLDVVVSRLKSQSKIDVTLELPKVPYRETVTRTAKGQGKHKKQSGGRGQYGDVWVRLEPLPEGEGFEFGWEVVGGVVPTKYQGAVEKGLRQAMERGIISGHRAVDIRAVCYDGSYHSVDSSDMAFQVAASKAFRLVAKEAAPVILEPIERLRVRVPEGLMGDVMGDLSSRRGRILGTENSGRFVTIEALMPLAETFEYSRHLRSLTAGRGTFEMEHDHYERVPADLQAKLVAAHKDHPEDED